MIKKSRYRFYSLGFLLYFLQQPAWADLWAYVDEQGATHFATERLDKRYELFFRVGESEFSSDDGPFATARPAVPPARGTRLIASFDTAARHNGVRALLRSAATTHGIDYELLQAMIVTESGFNAGALSPKGAVGLMQVMPATAQRFGVSNDATRTIAQKLVDPSVNVPAGTRYLRYLLDLFPGRLDLALAAYNAGEGAVQRAGNQIPAYQETQNYVRTVLDLYGQLKPHAPSVAESGAPGRSRLQLPGGAASRGNLPGTVGAASSVKGPARND